MKVPLKMRTGSVACGVALSCLIGLGGIVARAAEQPRPAETSAATTRGQDQHRSGGLKVGTAAVEFEADDSMVIAGGISPGKAAGQEGKLRAVAVVLEKKPFGKLAIVACDILMITRKHLDPIISEIETSTGISSSNILINCTHTHHAPSTIVLH